MSVFFLKTIDKKKRYGRIYFVERFLCLDIGDRRMGVAVSDPFNTYALPVTTIFRKNLKQDLEKVFLIAKEKCVTAIVCGLPVNFDGTPSIQTKKAEYFIEKLKETLSLPVYTVDERCTTCEAEETLISQGKSREERKGLVDSLAATSILEGFLRDRNRKNQKTQLERRDIMSEKEKKICDCGLEDCDGSCYSEEDIVELTAEDGRKFKFYFVDTIEYQGKNYSAFEPAEKIDGLNEGDLLIFELSGDDGEEAELLPVDDEALLDAVFEEFCRVAEEEEAAAEAEELQ